MIYKNFWWQPNYWFSCFWFTAFGNAKTRINDNSSRFVSIIGFFYWKYILIQIKGWFCIFKISTYIYTDFEFLIFRENTWKYRLTLKAIQLVASYQIVSNWSCKSKCNNFFVKMFLPFEARRTYIKCCIYTHSKQLSDVRKASIQFCCVWKNSYATKTELIICLAGVN